jgi:hypothetical protein
VNEMDFGTIFTSVVTSGIVTVGIQTFLKGGINNYYNKKIELFKDDVAKLSEFRRLDFERKIFDFGQYASKRHEVYPLVYKQLLIAKSDIFSMRGYFKDLTFEEYNTEDITEYLVKRKVPKGKISEITSIWDTNREQALLVMRKYLSLFKNNEIEDELIKARNLFLEFELFMSDFLSEHINLLLGALSDLFLIYQIGTTTHQEAQKIREEITVAFEILKKTMKDELSIGNYEK